MSYLDPDSECLAELVANRVKDLLRETPFVTPEWMTPEEAAIFLTIPAKTLADWRYKNEGPRFTRINGRMIRYHVDDLREWMKSRVEEPCE